MNELPHKSELLKDQLQVIYNKFKNDLHRLGLGEVDGEETRKFDFDNYGLSPVEKKERGEFKFDCDVFEIRKLIKSLEEVLRAGGEEAWQLPEREGGRYLESCFAGLEYIEDPKDVFASLVFRLTKNHPCEDGNKRISTVLFLQGLIDNGLTIEELEKIVDVEEFGMVMSQLGSEKSKEAREKISNLLNNLGYE